MNFNQTQNAALRTEPSEEQYQQTLKRLTNEPRLLRLIHVMLGAATEIGEAADPLKKHLFHGKPLDEHNIAEELGDLSWYLRIGCDVVYGGGGFETVVSDNITKLVKRFPNKFTEDDAIARADKVDIISG